MRAIIFLILLFTVFPGLSQEIWMHPNRGQWDSRIEYKVELQTGEMYIERNGWTINLNNFKEVLGHHQETEHNDSEERSGEIHVIKSKFIGSEGFKNAISIDSSSYYRNYLYGNDESNWKTGIHSLSAIRLTEIYSGTDLIFDGRNDQLKYSFDLEPGVDPKIIIIELSGQDKITLDEEGRLIIHNRFGEIIEDAPLAWNEIEGRKVVVPVEFELKGNQVSFNFPIGYDSSNRLIIDPNLTFSTFTGSTADNWGMTATPDPDGNLYAGGIVFDGAGSYPTTPGAFDVVFDGGWSYSYTFNGGTYNMQGFDIGISKFNATGTTMLYSTYLGGSNNEAPHSLVSDANGDLYVMGVTGSPNFPVLANAFDNTFNGGPAIAQNELGYDGADIFISHLSADGTTMVGCTFIGGTGTDGVNIDQLNYNYGDPFRGEIIVDNNGFVYVSSTSRSFDFPTINAFQGSLNGVQDAVLFKIDDGLTTMEWSTYFGGNEYETGNSVQISDAGDVYIAGGTNSTNLPVPVGNDLSFNGGMSDGYVARFDAATGAILSGTYMGLGEYDQTYFVQVDLSNEVYVYGQTESDWGVTPGTYGTPNSGQFIRKYSTDLSTILWSSMFGAGTGHVEISPTAFLVSDCYQIYVAGWGGLINSAYSQHASNSTSNGFQVTSDAYQATTTGNNFYLAMFASDMSSLVYGTFIGGSSSSYNHVDGGTSRFDKNGSIYHAVCGACGGNDYGFTTTPGVYSETNNSANCNLAAFKFELNAIEAIVANPDPYVCLPNPVIFNNNSTNGNFFYWDFGDGDTSTMENTQHVYPAPGDYTVTLVVSDTNGCFLPDSAQFDVHIGDFGADVEAVINPICPGESYQLEASGGTVYDWSPGQYLDDSTIYNPTATLFQTTDFMVVVSDSCGVDTVYVTVPVIIENTSISNDTTICIGTSAYLEATGGGTYSWNPPSSLNDANIANPESTPDSTTTYIVDIVSPYGCNYQESVTVTVNYDPPVPVIPDTAVVCEGSSTQINVSGADNYSWSPNINISPQTGPSVTITPVSSMYYYCDFINACGVLTDSVFVNIVASEILAFNDTIICPGETAQLFATGGVSYYWSPSQTLSSENTSTVYATPTSPTLYYVTGVDENGCYDSDSVYVDLFPQAHIQTNGTVYAIEGESVLLNATTSTPGQVTWSPSEFLSCVVCEDPTANPDQNYTYIASYTDVNGCRDSDTVTIKYDPIIYIPNTFTPDGNEFNQSFRAIVRNSTAFKMEIYNRWGELIYTVENADDFWDGTYKGIMCQDGTYTWKATVTDLDEINHIYVGHVNLLR